MNTTRRKDRCRERLNRIESWLIFGSLSFKRSISESERIRLFNQTIRLLERRLKLSEGELRWVLAQQGDAVKKRYHFHFLLDGSNLPNRDAEKLADNFKKLWLKVGGGNPDVKVHRIERDENGFQLTVNYVAKIECPMPFSIYFDAGEEAHIKMSESLDKHLAEVCAAAENNQKEKQ